MAYIKEEERKIKLKGPGYKLLYTLPGHKNAVSSVKFSPSGIYLASAAYDKVIKIWDVSSGTLECSLIGHEQGTSDIDWSSDSRLLVSASDDTNLKIWDVNRQQCVSTLTGHTQFVFCTKFSSSADKVISGSDDLSVKFWDVSSGKCYKTIKEHTDRVSAVDFSPERSLANLVLTCSYDGNCYLYDLKTYKQVLKLPCDGVPVSFAKFSPNGKYILMATLDNKLRLWDIFNADREIKCVRQYTGHKNKIFSVFSNFSVTGGKYIVSGSEDNFIYVWDLNKEVLVEKISGHKDVVLCTDCHPTENIIASGALESDKTVKLWRS